MKKIFIIGIILLGGLIYAYSQYISSSAETVNINEVSVVGDDREEAFQASQETSTSTSVESIEDDLNNTVIQDEDFSDIE